MLRILHEANIPVSGGWEWDYDYNNPVTSLTFGVSEAEVRARYEDYFSRTFAPRYFADGGVVTGPTMGLIGEAGYSEAVIPLKNTEIMDNLEGKSNKAIINHLAVLIKEANQLKEIMASGNRIQIQSKNHLDRIVVEGIKVIA